MAWHDSDNAYSQVAIVSNRSIFVTHNLCMMDLINWLWFTQWRFLPRFPRFLRRFIRNTLSHRQNKSPALMQQSSHSSLSIDKNFVKCKRFFLSHINTSIRLFGKLPGTVFWINHIRFWDSQWNWPKIPCSRGYWFLAARSTLSVRPAQVYPPNINHLLDKYSSFFFHKFHSIIIIKIIEWRW